MEAKLAPAGLVGARSDEEIGRPSTDATGVGVGSKSHSTAPHPSLSGDSPPLKILPSLRDPLPRAVPSGLHM